MTFLKQLFLLLSIVISFNSVAQISGVIKDKESNIPVPFANIILINIVDSSIVKARLSGAMGVMCHDFCA